MRSVDGEGDAVREAVGKRTDLLACVADEPVHKPELVDRLTASRSTVDRGIAELREAGLVERADGGFRATVVGELALDAYREYVDRTDGFAAVEDVANALPDASWIDPVLVQDCSVGRPETMAPETALEPFVSRLERADRLRGCSPVVRTSYIRLLAEHVLEGDLEAEIVVPADAGEYVDDLVHVRDDVAALLADEGFELLETEAPLPCALWVVDGPDAAAGITVDEDGSLAGVVSNDDPDAVAWAEDRYDEVRTTARPADLDPTSI